MLRLVAIVTAILLVDATPGNLAPSDNEAYVNKANAERQLFVNRIAASVGAGTGTAHLDGVPGTPLAKSRAYHTHGPYSHIPHIRSHSTGYSAGSAHGFHISPGYDARAAHVAAPHGSHVHATKPHGYNSHNTHQVAIPHAAHSPHAHAYPVTANVHALAAYNPRPKAQSAAFAPHGAQQVQPHAVAYPSHRAAYSGHSGVHPTHRAAHGGYTSYGRGASYGAHTAAYRNALRAYIARNTGYASAGYGDYNRYNGGYVSPFGGYGANYGGGYGYGRQNNAHRQHNVNLVALHKGSGVGTAPIYGGHGTYQPGHDPRYSKGSRKTSEGSHTGHTLH